MSGRSGSALRLGTAAPRTTESDTVPAEQKDEQVARMMKMFQGYRGAYGTYVTKGKATPGQKHKGKATTLHNKVTPDLWMGHLAGEKSVGIMTITEESMSHWGCIDVDIYTLNHHELLKRVKMLELPLVSCRTKSGGAHLYLFTSAAVPAALMQDKMTMFASALGLAGQEIFPKQRGLDDARGDLGSWVNMPYFNARQTVRGCSTLSESGAIVPCTLDEFLDLAEAAVLTEEQLEKLKPKALRQKAKPKPRRGQVVTDAADFTDGPVCFQTITDQGTVPEGTRNICLLNMGVYAKKRWADTWETELARLNSQYIEPPLPTDEVSGILRNLRKKEYYFNCKAHPLSSYCNAALCKTRENGIGAEEMSIRVTELRKLDTDPPLWFMDIESYGTVQMTTDQLNSAIAFTKACMEQLSFRPVVSGKAWAALLGECFEKLIIMEVSEDERADGSVSGAFQSLVSTWMQNPPAQDWNEVMLRKAYHHKDSIYFRFDDLMKWVAKHGFKEYRLNEAITVMKSFGATSHGQKKLPNGRVVRLWKMPITWADDN